MGKKKTVSELLAEGGAVRTGPSSVSTPTVPWYRRNIQLHGLLHVPVVDIVLMCKHLSVMLRAGLTVPESLTVLVEQSTGKLRSVLNRVQERVNGGSSLGDALAVERSVFSAVFVSAVVIGENSATLSENLNRLAKQMEKDLALRRTVQGAMMYPGIVFTAAVLLGFGVATFVLPQIAQVFGSLNVELPWSTRVLMGFAGIMDEYGGRIALGTFLAFIAAVWLIRRPFLRPAVHWMILHTPAIAGFSLDVNRARFCRTVGTLLESGTPIQEALTVGARAMPNMLFGRALTHMAHEIESGEKLSQVMHAYATYFPQVIERMVAVGERSGSLGSTLTYLADFYEERVEVASRNIASIIEPVLLLALGLIVGLVAVSILTPIYSITSSLKI